MENRCVCCGEIIPEGTQYCRYCDYMSNSKDDTYDNIAFEDAVSYRKPMPIAFNGNTNISGQPVFCCPICGNYDVYLFESNYCWDCGQALDWSDEAKEMAIKEYEERKKNDKSRIKSNGKISQRIR